MKVSINNCEEFINIYEDLIWETKSSKMDAGENVGYFLSIDNEGEISLTLKSGNYIYWNSRMPIARAWSNSTQVYPKEFFYF